jgi:hypothetical protein
MILTLTEAVRFVIVVLGRHSRDQRSVISATRHRIVHSVSEWLTGLK